MESFDADASPQSVEEIKQKTPPPQVDEEQDREYSCKYCDRKFTNKQALGGHQNAHKVQRAVEKGARVHAHGVHPHQQMNFAYPAGLVSPGSFLAYYNKSHEFMTTRSIINAPHSCQPALQQQHGIHVGYGWPRSGLRVVPDLYGPSRPPFGHNNGYFNWTAPAPHYYMPSHAANCQYSTPRANAGHVHVRHPFPGLNPGVRPCAGNIINQGNVLMNINQQVDDSGLDLSLKL